jgi:hypothetical protein
MSFELSPVNVQTPAGNAIDKINHHIAQNNISFGGDVLVTKTSGGTNINLKRRFKQSFEGVVYKGEWDPNAGYSVNDAVRVLPNVQYFYTANDVSPIPAAVGIWVCVARVPDKTFTDNFHGNRSGMQGHLRQSGIKYYPQYPEPDDLADPSATDGGANGRYWEKIGALGEMSYAGTYSTGSTYYAGQVVRVFTGNSPGLWICVATGSVQNVAPVYPEPAITGGINTWELFTLGVETSNICIGGNKIFYTHGIIR